MAKTFKDRKDKRDSSPRMRRGAKGAQVIKMGAFVYEIDWSRDDEEPDYGNKPKRLIGFHS